MRGIQTGADPVAYTDLRLLVAGVALATGLLLSGACAPADKSPALQVVLVTKALDSEWWQRVKAGAEEAARAQQGVKLAVLAPQREINIDQQVAILEDQIIKKVAALAVAPAGVAEVIPVLDKARAARIPVLIFDTDVPWPAKLSFIGLDNRLGGRLAGEYIVRAIKGRGKVAVIRGVLGVATHEERVAGFREAIAGAPAVRCVAIQPANSERALGMAVMENLLTSHQDLSAVFATNDQMALGAVEAIAGRQLTGKITVVGFDATHEAVRAVQAGLLSATLAGYPELMGRLAVEQAVKAARSEPVQPRIDIPTVVVTADNAADFLP